MIKQFLCVIVLAAAAINAAAQTHQHPEQPADDGQFNPNIVADGRGGFVFAFIQREGGKANIYLRRSEDGVSFSKPVRVNDLAGDAAVRNENPPKVAIGKRGEIFVCWASEREKWKGNIRFSRSLDGGRTFSKAISLNSDSAQPPVGHAFQSIAVDSRGAVYVAWIDERNKTRESRGAEIWMARSINAGATFGRDWKAISDVCECCRTNLQIDSRGRFLMTYRRVPAAGPMFRDVMLAVSLNSGRDFNSSVVSDDHWELNGCPVAGPGFAADSLGTLAVVWLTGTGERPGLYFAVSKDGGKTFSPRQFLEVDQRAAKHASIAAAGEGKFLLAWDDSGPARISTAWLDTKTLSLTKGGEVEGGAYPIVAYSGGKSLVTASRPATKAVFTGPAK